MGRLKMAELRDLASLKALFGNLKENWDGHGAWPIDLKALEVAHAFATKVRLVERERLVGYKDPWLVPLPDGRVALEWEQHGVRLDLAFDAEGNMAGNFKLIPRESKQ